MSATSDRVDENAAGDEDPKEALRGRITVLEAENKRLRQEYLRARQSQYRRSAIGLFAVGAIALGGAVLLPALRSTLLVLASTGGFGAALLYFLTPDRLVPASVGRASYDAYRTTATAIREELGLCETLVYVPLEGGTGRDDTVRLFVPQAREWELPDEGTLQGTFVAPDRDNRRGVAFTPSALTLWSEFASSTDLTSRPDPLATQLAEAAVEQFELVRGIETDIEPNADRVTVVVADTSYGNPTGFDHPLVSFLGVGLARGLDTHIEIESAEAVDDGHRISFRGKLSAPEDEKNEGDEEGPREGAEANSTTKRQGPEPDRDRDRDGQIEPIGDE